MNKTKILQDVLTLLKAAKESPEKFAELQKSFTQIPMNTSGVHTSSGVAPKKGVSEAGQMVRNNDMAAAKATHKDTLQHLKEKPKANLPKSEKNPDEKEDAELGEQVENAVEEHMIENKDKEKKEGHKIFEKGEGMNKSALDTAKELLKMAKENPAQFEELTKNLAPAAAPAPKPAMPPKVASTKPAMPKAPGMKAPGMQKEEDCTENKEAQGGKMTKEEIKSDLKQDWKPKFKKG